MSAGHVVSMLELEIPENPFPGLRPFEFNESLLYFGRDGQSEQLLRRLSATRFLAVVGTSGSGKSSVVRAGLLPALLGGFMTSAGSNWKIALMRPGFDPIGNLARALAAPEVLGSDGDHEVLAAMAESTLRRGNFGLMDLAQQARIGSGQNLLIVADQFEELFRVAGFAESEAYRNHAAAFVKLLLEASRQRELPIYVVLTMRSDFLGDCASFWGLPEAINEGQYLIPRLTREQRREAITGPIAVCGGAITERLVTRLLNDMGDDQDQLPLLQHALMRTWGKWKEEGAGRPAIDLEHYESIGGMSDALSLHVDEAFNSLPDARTRLIAEKAFKGLTEKGPDNREIRRPVTLAGLSLVTGASESELTQVIDTFREQGRSFLMPPAEVPLTSAAMIDISHESLIRNWRRLKAWVEEEARSARIYRRLAETAALHREGNASLWRDPDLQVALTWREQSRPNKEWAERYHHEFDEAIVFLDESLAERGAEQRAREAEARKESRRIWNTRLNVVLATAFIVCLGTAVFANWQKREAVHLRDQASMKLDEAREVTEKLKVERDQFEGEKQQAVEQANQANRNLHEASEKQEQANQQIALGRQLERQAREQLLHFSYTANINLAQRIHDAKDIAGADELLTATGTKDSRGFEWSHLWHRYHSAEQTIKGFERALTSLAFSPTQKDLLATGSADGTLALVNSVSGKSNSLKIKASSVWGSVFSQDGSQLVVLGDSNTVEVFDVASGHHKGTLPSKPEDGQIESITFWDGKLVTGNEVGVISVWELEGPHKSKTLVFPKNALFDVGALAAAPRGNILVGGYENGVLGVWDPTTVEPAKPNFVHGKITGLAVSSDGKLLAAATEEGWLAIWVTGDVFRQEDFKERGKQWEPLFQKELLSDGFNCLAFSEDGKELATAGTDGVVAFWDMQAIRQTRSELDRLDHTRNSATADSAQKSLEGQIQKLKTDSRRRITPGGDTVPREHSGPITCIAFSGDGHTFASGSSDRTVKIWRLGNGKNEEKGVISLDGHFVATVGPDSIKVLEGDRVLSTFPIEPNRKVLSMVFSPQSEAIVASLDDGSAKIYQIKTGKEIELSKGKQEISRNAKFVADWDGDGVRVWDTSRGEVSHQFLPRAGFDIQSQGFSPDSKAVAVSYSDGTAKLYYIETAEEFEIPQMGPGDQSVVFSRDSKLLRLSSTSSGRRQVQPRTEAQVIPKVWNVNERRLASRDEPDNKSELQEQRPTLTVRSTDGSKIASAQEEDITLSDSNMKHTSTKTKAHLLRVTSLAFSPDGKTLASGSLDGTVKLWRANSLEQLLDIAALKKTNGTLNPIVNLAFSSDSKRLAVGTETDGRGTVILWDLSNRQELLRLTTASLQPSLTFSADGMVLGSHTLGPIWLGARETDKVSSVSRETTGLVATLTWMHSRDDVAIPANALLAGYNSDENKALHVCRLDYKKNSYVGYTSGGNCNVADVDDGGPRPRQLNFGIYEILGNADSTSWIFNSEDSKDRSLKVAVGKREDGKEVAICRAKDESGIYVGWTVGDHCHIASHPTGMKFEILHDRRRESATTAMSKGKSE